MIGVYLCFQFIALLTDPVIRGILFILSQDRASNMVSGKVRKK